MYIKKKCDQKSKYVLYWNYEKIIDGISEIRTVPQPQKKTLYSNRDKAQLSKARASHLPATLTDYNTISPSS